jgi:hypothetical protein
MSAGCGDPVQRVGRNKRKRIAPSGPGCSIARWAPNRRNQAIAPYDPQFPPSNSRRAMTWA